MFRLIRYGVNEQIKDLKLIDKPVTKVVKEFIDEVNNHKNDIVKLEYEPKEYIKIIDEQNRVIKAMDKFEFELIHKVDKGMLFRRLIDGKDYEFIAEKDYKEVI